LRGSPPSGAARIDRFDHVPQLLLVGFAQRGEGVPGGAVGWNRRRREPFAVGELPEIVLRPHARIDRRDIDAGARLGHRNAGAARADRQSENELLQHRRTIDDGAGDFQPVLGGPEPRNASLCMVAMHPCH